MRTQLRERDLRSLDRRRLHEIFAPLDIDERLPRELLIEQRRFRSVGRREAAGFLWLPALVLSVSAVGWLGGGALAAVGAAVAALAFLCLFARSGNQ
jgi:fatty acid desaturase